MQTRSLLLCFLLIIGINLLSAQSISLPSTLKKFVPKGYTVLDTAMGNLNGDNLSDVLIALDSMGENAGDAKRPLLVLVQTLKGQYSLAARNDDAILCKECGGIRGDPFQNLVINKGYFSIELSGGSRWIWNKTTTFKWSAADKTWILHRIDDSDADTADPKGKANKKVQRSADFGKILFTKFSYDHPKLK